VPRPARTRNGKRVSIPMSDSGFSMRAFAVVAATVALTAGCGASEGQSSGEPKGVPESALPGLLLPTSEIESITGATGMVARQPTEVMADNANIVSNLDCLSAWQINQAPVYDPTFWKSMRQQVVRTPDSDDWTEQVLQSVVSWGTRDGAQVFFDDSVKRWSNCSGHTLNIRVNDQPLPKWVSGEVSHTDQELSQPFTRGTGDQTRSCQHVIRLAANVVFEVSACAPKQDAPVTQAADVAAAMEAKMPH
jgi:hypothetical protein